MLHYGRMKKILPLLAVAIVIIAGYFLTRGPNIDLTDKHHLRAYEGAKDVFDAQLQVMPFYPSDTVDATSPVASSTYLRTQWSAPEKIYNHFLITISDPQSDFTRTESGEHDRVTLDLSDLTQDTSYVIVLQACLDPSCERWLVSDVEYQGTTPVDPDAPTEDLDLTDATGTEPIL